MSKHGYKVGDFVEIVTLYPGAVDRGLRVGQVYPVIEVDEDRYVYVQADGYGITCLHAERVKPAKPAKPEPILFYQKQQPTVKTINNMTQQTPPPINISDQPMAIITMAEYLALKETERRYEKEIPPENDDKESGFVVYASGVLLGVLLGFIIQGLIKL